MELGLIMKLRWHHDLPLNERHYSITEAFLLAFENYVTVLIPTLGSARASGREGCIICIVSK